MALLLGYCAVTGCSHAADAGTKCSQNVATLGSVCPAGTAPTLASQANGNCDASGQYHPADDTVAVAGTCTESGACQVACILTTQCPCGASVIGKDQIVCRDECPEGCGDGSCEGRETSASCAIDCPATSGSGGGGSGGSSGSANSGGNAGKGGHGGSSSAKGGGAGEGSTDAASESGATGQESAGAGSGSTCGGVSEACCTSDTCDDDLTCLLHSSCSCAKGVFGTYVIRADGAVLQQPASASGAQTPVLDADTAKPLTGAIAGYDGGGAGCVVRDDGTVWCWRAATNGNETGSLGNGSTDTNGATFRATPVLTAPNKPLEHVKSIDFGYTCALTDDGQIQCWGDLYYLVNGGATLVSPYAQPITTDGATPLTGVVDFSVGNAVACALVANDDVNEVWCWGANLDQNLGTGDTTARKYPTKIVGLTNPSEIAVTRTWPGGDHDHDAVCAIDGGKVLCWGPNWRGQAGTADATNPVTAPTLVKLEDGETGLSGVTHLYPGYGRVCALRSNSSVWCWGSGYNDYADTVGLTNVVDVGTIGWGDWSTSTVMSYLTSDGLYHFGTAEISPKCGALQ